MEIENRQYKRVQFFLLHTERENLPVWVFQPDDDHGGMVGLIVDISQGGVQVLTDAAEVFPEGERLGLRIMAAGSGKSVLADCEVRHVWSRTDEGMYRRSGLAFSGDDGAEVDGRVIAAMAEQDAVWMRCTLRPLP